MMKKINIKRVVYESSVNQYNHYTITVNSEWRHRKAFDSFQLSLTGSSKIQLIHLIKRIQYKNMKNTSIWLLFIVRN